jgi:hypothetical protein
MSFIDLIALVVWPLVLSGVYLFLGVANGKTRFTEGQRWSRIGVAALLFFPPIIVLARYSSHSHLTFALWQLFFVFGGIFFLSLLTLVPFGAYKKLARLPLLLLISLSLGLGISLLTSGIWGLAGDHMFERERVEGVIEETQVIVTRSGPRFRVRINDRNFLTIEGALDDLRRGERILAETGRGTGMIYRLETISAD